MDDIINVTDDAKVRHVINTADDLKEYLIKKRHNRNKTVTDEEVDLIDMAPELIADVINAVSTGRDEKTSLHSSLTKHTYASQHDPELTRRRKKAVIDRGLRYDGDISARSVREKKSLTPSSDSSRPEHLKTKKDNRFSLKLNKTRELSTDEVEFREEMRNAKQEMRELMLVAAEASIANKDKEAKRNLFIAGLTTVTTIVAPIVTYFTSQEDCEEPPPCVNGTSS